MLTAVSQLSGFFQPTVIGVTANSAGLFRRASSVATPTGTATVYNSTTSMVPIPTPGGGQAAYVAGASNLVASIVGGQGWILDRLTSAGGFVGNVTTLQTFTSGPDVSVSTSNMAVRRGASNYLDVLWALEIFTTIGATASGNVTVTYTNAAGTSGLTVIAPTTIGGSGDSGSARRLVFFSSADGIRSVQSVQLTTSTGTAGNFGVSAFRVIRPLGAHREGGKRQTPWSVCVAELPTDVCLDACTFSTGSAGHGISLTTRAI